MNQTALLSAVCLLSALNSASANWHHSSTSGADIIKPPSSSGEYRCWHRSRSFISTKSTLPWTDILILTRGGSTEEEKDGATAVLDTKEGDEVVADDITIPNSNSDDSTTSTNDIDTTDVEPPPRNLTFGATKPHDGSLEDPDGIPSRFLTMKKNDRAEAKESFEGHLAWREEYGVATLLSRPHRKYDICKAMVPHYFAGRDPHNNIIFVQRPAMLDFELMRKNNSTIDDLLLHYIYVIEYCWNIFEPGPPEGVMTNVLDMKGLSFRNMKNQEYIGFGKRFVNMMSSNYPGRSYKTLVINAPKWFHVLYKVFKPLLRESTRQKIVILKAGEQQDTALKFYLGDALPRDLISNSKDATQETHEAGTRYFLPVEEREQCEPGPNSIFEYDMRQFVSLLPLCAYHLFCCYPFHHLTRVCSFSVH